MTDKPSATILVVDDDRDIVSMLDEGISSMEKYRIITALSGTEALEVMERDPPDLVLLDIMMTDMDGTEVCRAIRKHEKLSKIPVIALTVIHKMETQRHREIMAAGVSEHMEKPFTFNQLLDAIERHLE